MQSVGAGELDITVAVAGRPVVVIAPATSGAFVAQRVAATGAAVILVAPGAPGALLDRGIADTVTALDRAYVRGDLAGALLAICLEGGETANAVAAEATAEACLIHVAGHPELSTFRPDPGLLQPSTEESL